MSSEPGFETQDSEDLPPPKWTPYIGIAHEIFKIYRGLGFQGLIATPLKISRYFLKDSGLESPWSEKRILDLISDIIMDYVNELGPVYGRAVQIALSRLDSDSSTLVKQLPLDRLYHQWPPLDFPRVEEILDEELPDWQEYMTVEPHPIGVTSMAQVHEARDRNGRAWVIKILKPQAIGRHHETLEVINQILHLAEPLEATPLGKRRLGHIKALVASIHGETDLLREKTSIQTMREKLAKGKQWVLRLPEPWDRFCSRNVLTLEKFEGLPLAAVVNGSSTLSKVQKNNLARKALQELMVQAFEHGLFHGDFHSSNLILLDDGSLGILDWNIGSEQDNIIRKHIAKLLKSIITFNQKLLADSLGNIALDHQCEVSPKDIQEDVNKIADFVKTESAAGNKASIQDLVERSFQVAGNLDIPVPLELLMMAKSLVTIECLAKGIDPSIPLSRVIAPISVKEFKPDLKDFLHLTKGWMGLFKSS